MYCIQHGWYTAAEAIKNVIPKAEDNYLREWLKREDRKTVINAINAELNRRTGATS